MCTECHTALQSDTFRSERYRTTPLIIWVCPFCARQSGTIARQNRLFALDIFAMTDTISEYLNATPDGKWEARLTWNEGGERKFLRRKLGRVHRGRGPPRVGFLSESAAWKKVRRATLPSWSARWV